MILNLQKDLVITIDYRAYIDVGQIASGGFLVGVIPFYQITPGGVSAGAGLGYSDVPLLSVFVDPDIIPLSATGIKDAQIGVGFDFSGMFATSATGTLGLPIAQPNSISIRGRAVDGYPRYSTTPNLSTLNIPFTLFDQVSASQSRRVRIRFTDFGSRVIVDAKYADDRIFTQYINCKLPVYPVCSARAYLGFYTDNVATHFTVSNININGYDQTITYALSTPSYFTVTPSALFSETQTISATNEMNANWSLYTTYSAVGPLLVFSSNAEIPFVAGDSYVQVSYDCPSE